MGQWGRSERVTAGPAPCLNMMLATRDRHVLYQFPYDEQFLSRSPGLGVGRPGLEAGPGAAARRRTAPPIQAAVNFTFTPIDLDHPDLFGVTVVLMEENGYSVCLTEAFAR